MSVTLLIDADIVAYQVAATAQKTFDWGDTGVSFHVDDMAEVGPRIDDLLAHYVAALKATDLIVCLSCPTLEGFRYAINPTYKQHRDDSRRPELLKAVKDYMAEHYKTFARPTLEADDVMGILSTHPKLVPGKKIIVSEDKDMKTIPGWLFNPAKDKRPRMVTAIEADKFHLYQTLIGDATDGYPGCPGIGPDKATEFLSAPYILEPYEHVFKRGARKGQAEIRYNKVPTSDVWAGIVSLYEAAGLTEGDALLQARMARILRASDYDFKNKEPILWTPKKP